MSTVAKQLKGYFQLTKPTIILLVAITALMCMAAEGVLFQQPAKMFFILISIMLAAGSANAFNQILERDLDSQMERTKNKRPLPLGQLDLFSATLFAIVLAVISTFYLWAFTYPLAALLSLATILFYTLIYTLFLKRRYYYNIVIGGAAGAAAPLIASVAASGKISLLAWFLFIIIFTWTPPHFWALALALKDEYEKVKLPMLPNVLGDKRTQKEIWIYTLLLLPITVAPFFLDLTGWFFLICAFLLWGWYIRETFLKLKVGTYKKLFHISIVYLFFLFIAVGIDGAFRYFNIIS